MTGATIMAGATRTRTERVSVDVSRKAGGLSRARVCVRFKLYCDGRAREKIEIAKSCSFVPFELRNAACTVAVEIYYPLFPQPIFAFFPHMRSAVFSLNRPFLYSHSLTASSRWCVSGIGAQLEIRSTHSFLKLLSLRHCPPLCRNFSRSS